jgi:hypothetical protein
MLRALFPKAVFLPDRQFPKAVLLPNKRSVHTLVTFHSWTLHSKVSALINSGAMDNFISPNLIRYFNIPTFNLPRPQTIRNVDRTKNNIGNISAAAYLDVTHNNKKGWHTFYIIDLGEDHMPLGMPFLADTNSEIDWTLGQLQGKVKAATTDAHRWHPHRHSKVHKPFKVNTGTRYQPHNMPPPDGEYKFINTGPEDYNPNTYSIIRRLTKSTDLAAENVITITRPWRTLVPKEYHRFGKVFSEHAANRFPGKRP